MNITKPLLAILASITVAACGGGSGSSGPAGAITLGGAAGVSYPIANGTVQIMCAGGAPLSTSTDSTGVWQVTISGQTPPCAIEVSGGTINDVANSTPYHSIATSFGTVNVTPLSDLVLANLAGTATPNIWFAGLTPAAIAQITLTSINTALANQCAALSGLPPLCTTNPITTVFTPTSGNALYNMVVALQMAMLNSGVTYTSLLNNASAPTYAAPVASFNTALTTAYTATTAAISATAVTTAKSLTVGTPIASFSPIIPTGGATPYAYSYTGTLPAGLNFSSNTGVISGTPSATYATANLVFSVKDANNVVANTTSSVSFTVGAAPATISATANTTAQSLTAGTAMTSFLPLTPSGGASPYTYSYAGTLPAGLSFGTSTGAVTGTPSTTYATANLVFSVKDANNIAASTTSTVNFTVGAATVNISATANTTAQNLTVGVPITSFSPLIPAGGTAPYTYSYTGTLPAGLSFNTSTGAVAGTPNATYATANLVFSVKDANNVVASTTSTVSFTVGAASGGSLDTSFNLTGKALTSFGISNEIAKAVAIQTDGKIIAVGSVAGFLTGTFALARYNIDGTLDTTFGTNGKVTTSIGANVSGANSVAIRSDGKIVAAGYWGDGGGIGFLAMARYNIDGSLDTSFGTGGKVTGNGATGLGVIQAMVLQADQKIIIAGGAGLVRYSSNGSIDTTFGANGTGIVTTSIGSFGYTATSVAIQADNKIVTAGYYVLANGISRAFALVRYNANGSLDTTFDTDGIVTTSIGTTFDAAYAVAIQADKKIVATGTTLASTTAYDLALVRYNENGSLDVSFDTDGIVTADMGYGDAANGLAIQADNKIVVAAGYNVTSLALITGVAGAPFSLVRYNANGSLDTTFGTAGKVTAGTGASQAVVIQADNKILAVGSLYNGTENDFGVVRFIP